MAPLLHVALSSVRVATAFSTVFIMSATAPVAAAQWLAMPS
jgi:hypothetical protein